MPPAVSSSRIPHVGLVAIGLTLLHPGGAVARSVPAASASIELLTSLPPSSSCNDLGHCRTKWSIIWSCLTTLFACIWVANHSDIPDIYDGSWEFFLRRSFKMFMALGAPETILLFALRQRVAAGRLERQYKSASHFCPHSTVDSINF